MIKVKLIKVHMIYYLETINKKRKIYNRLHQKCNYA